MITKKFNRVPVGGITRKGGASDHDLVLLEEEVLDRFAKALNKKGYALATGSANIEIELWIIETPELGAEIDKKVAAAGEAKSEPPLPGLTE